MVPTRRALLAAGSTALLPFAGCLGVLRSGHVDVRIDNRDDRPHAIGVTFRAEGAVAAEERFEVPAETETDAEAVVEAGEYAVTVTLDGDGSRDVPFTMQGCSDNALFVTVDAEATMEADVLDEC